MKIAVNARFLIKDKLEGIGWYSYEVLYRICQNYPEHEFLFLFDRPFDSSFVFGPNVKAQVVFPPARRSYLWFVWFEWAIPYYVNKFQADVFFSPDGFASLRLNIPQYIIFHDLAYLHYPKQIPFFALKFYQTFVPKYLRKAKHIFAVSEATRKDIIQQFALDPNKCSVAYNGVRQHFVPIEEKQKIEIRNEYSLGSKFFLFVGALHPRKNVHNLIKAFNSYKSKSNNSIKLLILGRPAFLTNEIFEVYNNSPFKNEIIFVPYTNSSTLALITASATASILPSFLEGFGVPVLEALRCKVPVIVSDRFSLPEVGGPGAFLINPNDSNSITKAMEEIVTNEFSLLDRVNLGFLHSSKFSWDVTAEHIMNTIINLEMKK